MSFVTAVCCVSAIAQSHSLVAVAIFAAFLLTLFWHASIFERDTLFGIPVPKITFAQWCMLMLIVAVLLGLSIPAHIQS